MTKRDLPDIYARGLRARAYISGKSRVAMVLVIVIPWYEYDIVVNTRVQKDAEYAC